MEKQIVIFFDGYFKKLDASVLLENGVESIMTFSILEAV